MDPGPTIRRGNRLPSRLRLTGCPMRGNTRACPRGTRHLPAPPVPHASRSNQLLHIHGPSSPSTNKKNTTLPKKNKKEAARGRGDRYGLYSYCTVLLHNKVPRSCQTFLFCLRSGKETVSGAECTEEGEGRRADCSALHERRSTVRAIRDRQAPRNPPALRLFFSVSMSSG